MSLEIGLCAICNMGGLSCVAGKPEGAEQPMEARPTTRQVEEGRESQLPWNRHSQQVYCGEPRKINDTSQDEPPDKSEQAQQSEADNDDKGQTKMTEDISAKLPNGDVLAETKPDTSKEKAEVKTVPVSNESAENEGSSDDGASDKGESTDSELNDSVPEISVDPPSKFYCTHPVDYSEAKVIKRPRSLDSADQFGNIRKSRPMSYSPASLKTVHPRSLHCITEAVNAIRSPPLLRQRPQSMDFTGLFDTKGFDHISHRQKLKRMLTSPKKHKEHKDNKNKNPAGLKQGNSLQIPVSKVIRLLFPLLSLLSPVFGSYEYYNHIVARNRQITGLYRS